MKTTILALLVILLCQACSSTPSIYTDGSADHTKLNNNVYSVQFQGRDLEHSNKMLFVKCSELTLTNGNKFFTIIDSKWEARSIMLNYSLEVSKIYTLTHVIQFTETPVPGRKNFDADLIFKNHLKAIGWKSENQVTKR